ncbi:MAG: PAS domain S-box protein [Chloroflexota bacterium]
MGLIQSLLRWHRNLPYTDPLKRRLAPVFQIFLVSLIVILLFAIILSLMISGLTAQGITNLAPALVFGLALVGGLYALRRGNFNWAIGIIIVSLLLNQERTLLLSGFLRNQQALLTSIWALMLAGFLLSRRWLILTVLVNFVGVAFVAIHEQALLTPEQLASGGTTPIARLTGFALIILLTCIMIDTFARVFRGELEASTQREHKLEAEIAAREQAEQSLAEQREQYRVTLSSIGDAVIATDTTGKVTFLNEVAETLVGWTRGDALGQPLVKVFSIFNEETLEPVANPLTRVLSEGVVVGLANHTVLLTPDGKKSPIADSGAPIRSNDGKIIGAVLVFRDVTEERKSEVELKASEERFRTMADNAPVLIWMSGGDKGGTYFNKQWLDFTGRRLEQELGVGWLEGIHPDDKDRCWETYTSAFDKRESFSMEYRLRRADGDYRWVIDKGDPNIYDDGSFIGYIGSCMDITTRKEAEDRTRLLQMLTAALSSALTSEDVAQVFIEKGFSLLGAQRGTVALLNGDNTLEIVGQYNMPNPLLETYLNADLDNTPLGQAIRTQSPVWIENFVTYQSLFPELANQVSTAAQNPAIVCLPMIVHNHTIGGISIRFDPQQRWDDERRAFMLSLAGQCAQAMERAQLFRQAQLAAAVEERQRLARELHDAVSQTLFSATIMAESLPNTWQRNPQRGIEFLKQLVTLNRAAMSEMRTMLLELRPEALLKTNMSTLIQQLIEAAKGRRAVETDLVIEGGDITLPPAVHVALYRIAQESINNILKHSEATEFSVHLHMDAAHAQLRIRDNGKGFDLTALNDGLGLENIRERAQAINAALDLQSQSGQGTEVFVSWTSET